MRAAPAPSIGGDRDHADGERADSSARSCGWSREALLGCPARGSGRTSSGATRIVAAAQQREHRQASRSPLPGGGSARS
jgi:hypothetical protein